MRSDIDPMEVAFQIEDRYNALWDELTAPAEFAAGETFKIEQRLQRLHELGFDVEEMEIVDEGSGDCLRYIPRVVEHGFHRQRLKNLTGLETTENQARRLLDDIRQFGAEMHRERLEKATRSGRPPRPMPENVVAVRWLDDRFEPLMAMIPPSLFAKLEGAEIYHQLLEHRWFLSEEARVDISLEEALESYIDDVLTNAPDEVNIARKGGGRFDQFDTDATFDGV